MTRSTLCLYMQTFKGFNFFAHFHIAYLYIFKWLVIHVCCMVDDYKLCVACGVRQEISSIQSLARALPSLV